MTLQEAIKSGRPFKRVGWGSYWLEEDSGLRMQGVNGIGAYCDFKTEDILADDYVLKEKEPTKLELTAKEICDALEGSIGRGTTKLILRKLKFPDDEVREL